MCLFSVFGQVVLFFRGLAVFWRVFWCLGVLVRVFLVFLFGGGFGRFLSSIVTGGGFFALGLSFGIGCACSY